MQENTKHALTNPTLWINLGCLASALVATAMNDEWVKHYPFAVMLLVILNFSITSGLQYLRDLNKSPVEGIDVVDKTITEKTIVHQEISTADNPVVDKSIEEVKKP